MGKSTYLHSQILEINNNNPIALQNLGSIYKNLGDFDQAFSSTLKSLKIKPDNYDALSNLLGTFQEGDLTILKKMAHNAVKKDQNILGNLNLLSSYHHLASSSPEILQLIQT